MIVDIPRYCAVVSSRDVPSGEALASVVSDDCTLVKLAARICAEPLTLGRSNANANLFVDTVLVHVGREAGGGRL
jgi:hypothetical protein